MKDKTYTIEDLIANINSFNNEKEWSDGIVRKMELWTDDNNRYRVIYYENDKVCVNVGPNGLFFKEEYYSKTFIKLLLIFSENLENIQLSLMKVN